MSSINSSGSVYAKYMFLIFIQKIHTNWISAQLIINVFLYDEITLLFSGPHKTNYSIDHLLWHIYQSFTILLLFLFEQNLLLCLRYFVNLNF